MIIEQRVKVRVVGNSAVVTIPQKFLDAAGIAVEDTVVMTVDDGERLAIMIESVDDREESEDGEDEEDEDVDDEDDDDYGDD